MPDISLEIDTAVTTPVNVMPLVSSSDFITIMDAVAYDAAGMDLRWNFITTAGVQTSTPVVPTSGGSHDWTHLGDAVYNVELPASGGTVNNDTEGTGWWTGQIAGVLPFRGPLIAFGESTSPPPPPPPLVSTDRFYVQNLLANNPLVTTTPAAVEPTAASISGWWHAFAPSDPADAGTLSKTAGDERYFGFDFGNLDELVAGQTIDYAIITAAEVELVVGATEMANAYSPVALFAGGNALTDYVVTCTIELSGGSTVVRTGNLKVVGGG